MFKVFFSRYVCLCVPLNENVNSMARGECVFVWKKRSPIGINLLNLVKMYPYHWHIDGNVVAFAAVVTQATKTMTEGSVVIRQKT